MLKPKSYIFGLMIFQPAMDGHDVLDYDEEAIEEDMNKMNKDAEEATNPEIEIIDFFWSTEGTMQCPVERVWGPQVLTPC